MQEELREEVQQQEAKVAHREFKARPIMMIFEDLKRISIRIDIAIEIHFQERLHWNLFVTLYFFFDSSSLKFK